MADYTRLIEFKVKDTDLTRAVNKLSKTLESIDKTLKSVDKKLEHIAKKGFGLVTQEAVKAEKSINKVEKSVNRVNIVLDNDARKEALELSEYLISEGIDVRMVDIPNDTDPNELGREKINELINKTETLDFRKIVEMKFGL